MNFSSLSPWEKLQKQMTWDQIGSVSDLDILDFGSGNGVTAAHFARHNRVTAVEPDREMTSDRDQSAPYRQIQGDVSALERMGAESFDLILCHNVLEYAGERMRILREFVRLLRPAGQISILKHNRPGRVMQTAVLLNQFDRAHALLDGKASTSEQFGVIHYYEDEETVSQMPELRLKQVYGMRTFWDLQQNQEIQRDTLWQAEMLELEKRVSRLEPYRSIAFFHHLLFAKEQAV